MRVFSEPELVASLIRKDFDGKAEQAAFRTRGVLCRIITVAKNKESQWQCDDQPTIYSDDAGLSKCFWHLPYSIRHPHRHVLLHLCLCASSIIWATIVDAFTIKILVT
jgi:hypothetical protein